MKELTELTNLIHTKMERQTELLTELNRSKLIETIWPEAFLNHQSVSFGGLLKMMPYPSQKQGWKCAYFRSHDGRKKYLTKEELLIFKPEVKIHPSYKQEG